MTPLQREIAAVLVADMKAALANKPVVTSADLREVCMAAVRTFLTGVPLAGEPIIEVDAERCEVHISYAANFPPPLEEL